MNFEGVGKTFYIVFIQSKMVFILQNKVFTKYSYFYILYCNIFVDKLYFLTIINILP